MDPIIQESLQKEPLVIGRKTHPPETSNLYTFPTLGYIQYKSGLLTAHGVISDETPKVTLEDATKILLYLSPNNPLLSSSIPGHSLRISSQSQFMSLIDRIATTVSDISKLTS